MSPSGLGAGAAWARRPERGDRLCAPGRAKCTQRLCTASQDSGSWLHVLAPSELEGGPVIPRPGCLPTLALSSHSFQTSQHLAVLRVVWDCLAGHRQVPRYGDREPISELVKLRSEQGMQGPPCASSFSPSPRAGEQPFIFQMFLSPGDIMGARVSREGALPLSLIHI